MKTLFSILAALTLVGCGEQPVRKGFVEFIHYRTSPNTSTLLTTEDYKGSSPATETLKWRNPQVALYREYIVISYPDTDQKDLVIPRESLLTMRWK